MLINSYLLHQIFGRDCSAQSRAFGYFINHVFKNFSHLLHSSEMRSWWRRNGFWEQSAEAVEIRKKDRYALDGINMVSHFIDCNRLPTTRCGGGPAQEGGLLFDFK